MTTSIFNLLPKGDPHLSKVADLPFLVIDEADRMVEQGHFAELANILDRLPQPKYKALSFILLLINKRKVAEGSQNDRRSFSRLH